METRDRTDLTNAGFGSFRNTWAAPSCDINE
eukprot:COSAG06_NODE_35875_length_454_cov_1.256338_1_plen_30_part_10